MGSYVVSRRRFPHGGKNYDVGEIVQINPQEFPSVGRLVLGGFLTEIGTAPISSGNLLDPALVEQLVEAAPLALLKTIGAAAGLDIPARKADAVAALAPSIAVLLPEASEEEADEEAEEGDGLDDLKRPDLLEIADELGVAKGGKNADIIERIREARAA